MNGYMIQEKTYDLEPDSVERKTIGIMTKLWTNFAKFGYEIDYFVVFVIMLVKVFFRFQKSTSK